MWLEDEAGADFGGDRELGDFLWNMDETTWMILFLPSRFFDFLLESSSMSLAWKCILIIKNKKWVKQNKTFEEHYSAGTYFSTVNYLLADAHSCKYFNNLDISNKQFLK